MTQLSIRPMEAKDAAQVMALCGQLGYTVDLESLTERFHQIAGSGDRAVLVACEGAAVLGWLDLSVEFHLQAPPVALIGGLVVEQGARGQGIGRELCLAAENWARARGLLHLRVRSNAVRERAHAFYRREGFEQVKTSAAFEKDLRPAWGG